MKRKPIRQVKKMRKRTDSQNTIVSRTENEIYAVLNYVYIIQSTSHMSVEVENWKYFNGISFVWSENTRCLWQPPFQDILCYHFPILLKTAHIKHSTWVTPFFMILWESAWKQNSHLTSLKSQHHVTFKENL